MRIWDIDPKHLCRQHLLGEHRELHAIWNILTQNKKGYRNHPEIKRWEGKLLALYLRHINLVKEMEQRGYKHKSFFSVCSVKDKYIQDQFINSIEEQKEILKLKNCQCFKNNIDK